MIVSLPEGCLNDLSRIFEDAENHPGVDVVEIRSIGPFILDVIHNELDVRRKPHRLNRTEVNTCNLGAWHSIADYMMSLVSKGRNQEEAGYDDELSTAQSPKPVPRSMIFCTLGPIGAK